MDKYISPFQQIHKSFSANFQTYCSWQLPSDYGNAELEAEKLYSSCTAFDLSSFGKIQIIGQDAAELIKYLTASKTDDFNIDDVKWAIICHPNGYLADICRIIVADDSFTICTSPPKKQMILNLAEDVKQQLNLKAEITDKTTSTAMMGLYGPTALDIAGKVLPFSISDIPENTARTFNIFMITATVIRSNLAGPSNQGIEILTSAKAASLAGMAIGKYQEKGDITPAGMTCLNRALLEASLPISVEDRKNSPSHLPLLDKIDFAKNFIGKESLEQISQTETNTKTVFLKIPKLRQRLYNLEIIHNNQQIGTVDVADYSKFLDLGIALAIIDRQHCDIHCPVQLQMENSCLEAEILPGPVTADLANNIYNAC